MGGGKTMAVSARSLLTNRDFDESSEHSYHDRRRDGAERDSGADGEFGEGTRKHVAQPPSAHYNASNA